MRAWTRRPTHPRRDDAAPCYQDSIALLDGWAAPSQISPTAAWACNAHAAAPLRPSRVKPSEQRAYPLPTFIGNVAAANPNCSQGATSSTPSTTTRDGHWSCGADEPNAQSPASTIGETMPQETAVTLKRRTQAPTLAGSRTVIVLPDRGFRKFYEEWTAAVMPSQQIDPPRERCSCRHRPSQSVCGGQSEKGWPCQCVRSPAPQSCHDRELFRHLSRYLRRGLPSSTAEAGSAHYWLMATYVGEALVDPNLRGTTAFFPAIEDQLRAQYRTSPTFT